MRDPVPRSGLLARGGIPTRRKGILRVGRHSTRKVGLTCGFADKQGDKAGPIC